MRRVYDEEGNRWHKDAERVKNLNSGVSGAHCSIPFQCEICWIRNLEYRNPQPEDDPYLMTIRRANLDAMAGKSRHTLAGHRRRTTEMVNHAVRIGKTPSLQPRGPFPLGDQVGMGLAVDIIQKSLVARGKTEAVVQAETLRQLRSTYTKNWESSPLGVAESAAFAKGTSRVRPTKCPAQSEWYQDFWRGLEARMGYKSSANHAISIAAMTQAIAYVKEDALTAETTWEANHLWKLGAYLTLTTAASLRGYEGFFLDLAALRKHIHVGQGGSVPSKFTKNSILTNEQAKNLPHLVLPLLGKFKGEIGIDHHMVNIASFTKSGLEPRWWAEKLIEVTESEGRFDGPAFGTPDGALAAHAVVPLRASSGVMEN